MSVSSLSVRAIKSERARLSLIISALSSLGNLSISIAVARIAEIEELGQFAVAFAVYALATGFVRSAVVEPLSANFPSRADFRNLSKRASVLGIIFGAAAFLVGVSIGHPYLVIVGMSIHGSILYEYIKLVSQASMNARVGVLQESLWLVVSLAAATLTVLGTISPLAGFACWIGVSAVLGYLFAAGLSISLLPAWTNSSVSGRTSISFGSDFLLGSGAAQISMTLLAGLAGNPVVGALRGAGTLFGPITIIVNSARALLIPVVSRFRRSDDASLMSNSIAVSTLLVLTTVPLLLLICFLPGSVGELVLGANWSHSAPLLPFLAAELLFSVMSTVPFAGHRSHDAGRRTLLLRSFLAPLRLLVVVPAGIGFGALGAAIAMAFVSAVSSMSWWFSYANLINEKRGQ